MGRICTDIYVETETILRIVNCSSDHQIRLFVCDGIGYDASLCLNNQNGKQWLQFC